MTILPGNRDKDVRVVRLKLFSREIKTQCFLRIQFSIENCALLDERIRRLSGEGLCHQKNRRRKKREDEKDKCGSHKKNLVRINPIETYCISLFSFPRKRRSCPDARLV